MARERCELRRGCRGVKVREREIKVTEREREWGK